MKCSISELKEILSLKSHQERPSQKSFSISQNTSQTSKHINHTSNEILVKQYPSKYSPGKSIIRGYRANNPNNLISDYPLSKNFAKLNKINSETLKNLLKTKDLENTVTLATQTEKIASKLQNEGGKRNLDAQKRKLKMLFMTKADFDYFPFRKSKKSFIEKLKSKISSELKKNSEESNDSFIGLKVSGSIEKSQKTFSNFESFHSPAFKTQKKPSHTRAITLI